MPPTNSGSIIQDWTGVSSGVVVVSTVIDTSGNYETDLQIQAMIEDQSAAHAGTKFQPQISSLSSGDEDWVDYGGGFIDLVGTAAALEVDTGGVLAAATTIPVAADNVPETGIWMGMITDDPADNELVFVKSIGTGDFVIINGLTNAYAAADPISSVAFSRNIKIQGTNILRARVIVDNNYDTGGAGIIFKLAETKTTGL